uniref:PNPLA domain-containing protein n=1 Tax=Magallana gigas TaxID=29159 RepID=A0A8W8MC69_MAGGI
MGNVFGEKIETDPGDIQYKEILEARKRYLDEQFIQDVEKELEKATPDDTGNTGVNRKSPSILNEIEIKAMSINPKDHSYPFENLVFEGGGAKGYANSGANKALEELGLVSQIRRFAGVSAGAISASLLAVGYDVEETQDLMGQDLSSIVLDAKCGILSLLPNLLTRYEWHPGNRFYNWFGELLEKKMGNKDVTFDEHYRKTGLELCIIVTNVNLMREEYCHVKTTPSMSIRTAVRMSIALPGLVQPTHYTCNGETNTYVDGGLICNYPIHCYDGWWLSMDSKDSFLEKLKPLDDLQNLLDQRQRFALDQKDQAKTLGFVLYADSETDMFRFMCEKRIGVQLDPIPNTKLGKIKLKQKKDQEKAKREDRRVVMAVDEFLKEEFSTTTCEILFGTDCTVQNAFDLLDKEKSGEPQDLDRTVGINTGHVGLTDFKLEEEDMRFVIDQGYKSTMTFLKYFAAKEELLKNAEESLQKRIQSKSSTLEYEVKD